MELLTVDIGNTTISLGIVKNQRVLKSWRIETVLDQALLRSQLHALASEIKRRSHNLEAVVVCSVVPQLSEVIESHLARVLRIKISRIGRDLKVPIINRYRNPRQVGQDRLVGSFAAARLYGTPLIVIDFGTAITFDVVSKNKEYLGGIIVPGLRLTAESLWKKTALLPKVDIQSPRELIGRDTKNSILSGIFYGYGALCDGLIDRITEKMRSRPIVIVTGGYSHWMRKFISRDIQHVDKNLIFKGMSLVYQASRPVSLNKKFPVQQIGTQE